MKASNRFIHLAKQVSRYIPASRIYTDPLYTLAKGTDASFYRLVPGLVIRVESEAEVVRVLALCSRSGIPVTFKAGGTSLSGQTITDSVLVEVGDGFKGFSVLENGRLVKLQCGITGGLANTRLAKYGKRIGPDPASIGSAKIGGIVSNNASGGAFGIKFNSYHTLRGMRIIFADGTLLDTGDNASRQQFSDTHPEVLRKLLLLSWHVKSDPLLKAKILHKYELKNTCGYGLNSLIDFEDPFDIITHLMVGAEGTLGFIADVTLETVEDFPLKATALVFFPTLRSACEVIPLLKNCKVTAAELMDGNALRSVREKPGMPAELSMIGRETVALLVDTSAHSMAALNEQVVALKRLFSTVETIFPVDFTNDKLQYEKLWKVRKGLFTSAAAVRPAGAACIIEDLTFRHEVLADALGDLRKLIEKYGYVGSVIWGHVLDGNIHFVIMPDFSKPESIENYRRFMDDLVQLTLQRYDGSLKGEHGTGRNMAPFVRVEWGDELYRIMQEIKKIFDPDNLLNPGVLLNNDPEIHLKNIKSFPPADNMIDPCIECGFCEISCPSATLTLTPRQRIVAFRALKAMEGSAIHSPVLRQMRKSFRYHADATCATDGLCSLTCPVEINTGKLIKQLRFRYHSPFSHKVASYVAGHMGQVTALVRIILSVVSFLHRLTGTRFLAFISKALFKLSGGLIPFWNPYMPAGAASLRSDQRTSGYKDNVVYFPTCINRSMGKSIDYEKQAGVIRKTGNLLNKAGFNVIYPENVNTLCCGMAFESKGFAKQAKTIAKSLEIALLAATQNGKYPVYCDMSPCLLHMKETLDKRLALYEPVEFIMKHFPGKLHFRQLPRKVAVHSTCSNTRMGLDMKLRQLAGMCASEVVVPDEIGCCGWAGDRGFTVPALNAAALAPLRSQLPADVREGYSTSRTCEIGLSLHSGISYKSIVYLVDEATRALSPNEEI